MELLEYLRIDDPVGAWPVHGVCGIWGTVSLGLFASGQYSAAGSSPIGVPTVVAKSADALTGLFYGGGLEVLEAQCIGSAIVCTATFVSAMVMFKRSTPSASFASPPRARCRGSTSTSTGPRPIPST